MSFYHVSWINRTILYKWFLYVSVKLQTKECVMGYLKPRRVSSGFKYANMIMETKGEIKMYCFKETQLNIRNKLAFFPCEYLYIYSFTVIYCKCYVPQLHIGFFYHIFTISWNPTASFIFYHNMLGVVINILLFNFITFPLWPKSIRKKKNNNKNLQFVFVFIPVHDPYFFILFLIFLFSFLFFQTYSFLLFWFQLFLFMCNFFYKVFSCLLVWFLGCFKSN